MTTVVIVIHLLLAIAMILLVLMQQSEGGGLGIGTGGGGGGGMGGFMSSRGTANLLTRATATIAALFMITSLALALLGDSGQERRSIIDTGTPPSQPTAPKVPNPLPLPTPPTN